MSKAGVHQRLCSKGNLEVVSYRRAYSRPGENKPAKLVKIPGHQFYLDEAEMGLSNDTEKFRHCKIKKKPITFNKK